MKKYTEKQMEAIHTLADIQMKEGAYIISVPMAPGSDQDLLSPWVDESGKLDLSDEEAIAHWGEETFSEFCKKALAYMKDNSTLLLNEPAHGFMVNYGDLTPEAKDRFTTYFGNDVDDDLFVAGDYFYYTGEGILTDPEDKRNDDPDSRPAPLITDIIEAFESFLEEKGINVPNAEKDDDPEASTIYGSDYGDLFDEIEAILKSYGIDKNSVS